MMFVKLKRGKQKKLFSLAISKAGSERKLSKIINIPNGTISGYRHEKTTLSLDRFNLLLSFLGNLGIEFRIEKILQSNWKQVKGGKNCVLSKKRNGTFKKNIDKMKKASSKRMKKWHKDMKSKNPEQYYNIQYSRFKKIGNYKLKTNKGHLVRNILEKDIANILLSLGLNYKYEHLINIKKKYYFPDFIIGNIILECTMWKGFQKIPSLKSKISHMEKEDKNVFVIIPRNLYKYYSTLGNKLIFAEDFASVAQTLFAEQ